LSTQRLFWKSRGKVDKVAVFLKKLFPSRNSFWKILLEGGILTKLFALYPVKENLGTIYSV
jgi:hypothetical protein